MEIPQKVSGICAREGPSGASSVGHFQWGLKGTSYSLPCPTHLIWEILSGAPSPLERKQENEVHMKLRVLIRPVSSGPWERAQSPSAESRNPGLLQHAHLRKKERSPQFPRNQISEHLQCDFLSSWDLLFAYPVNPSPFPWAVSTVGFNQLGQFPPAPRVGERGEGARVRA